MNALIIFLGVLIAFVYAKYYLSPNPVFQILQTSITRMKPALLFEKSPIIIEEPLVSSTDLPSRLFRYLYILKTVHSTTPSQVLQQNKCKYLILSPQESDTVVQIVHPRHSRLIRSNKEIKDSSMVLVDIKLQKHQCMILPLYWWYKTATSSIHRIQLDDALSVFLGKIG